MAIQETAESSEGTSFTVYGEPRLGRTRWGAGAKPRTKAELFEQGKQVHEIIEAYLAEHSSGDGKKDLVLLDEFDYTLAREVYFSSNRLRVPPVSYDPASTPIFFGEFKL